MKNKADGHSKQKHVHTQVPLGVWEKKTPNLSMLSRFLSSKEMRAEKENLVKAKLFHQTFRRRIGLH